MKSDTVNGDELNERLLEREADIEEIGSCVHFVKEAINENKKLWYLAAPAIFTSIAQYSLGAITQVFAGHLTTLELDAVSTENMVIAGLAFGIMLGMGSALETLCGQAFGAKKLHMLGVYMQRSWVILNVTCVCLLPIYIFATPILKLFGQNDQIAELAGKFSLYMIPQLFAYGFNFPIQKFLQAQSKVMTMAWVSGVALLFHILLSWLFIVQFKLGLAGAAAALNISWWVVVLGQFAYIAMGYCPGAWTGFSWSAFRDLGAFARLSVASAIMMCLEFWYYMVLIVLAGRLQNAEIAVAAISICNNLNGWEIMIFFGFNAAISVRISNELGAGRPNAAKFSILVVVLSSALMGMVFFVLVLALRNVYALPFTNSSEVADVVSHLAVIFAFTLLLNSVQPVLTGVAVGAGWQWLVAYVNVGCYYIVGIPLGFCLGSLLNMGVKGIWTGMITGVGLQTLILTGITLATNWNKEAMQAESRIKKWGGSIDSPVKNIKDSESKKVYNV
ncbi:PREDICTED: protein DETOXIFICATION 33-like [Nelumbo nucifera]|uniref:Protein DETOXIFICATION n=1 Tax=Nelumbo nucifera TaxID=4432 RepID=A0A1U8AI91_NELNU|nr:PREDICTED: protein DETOXIFICATION 33-like [Nelumbo nucifera]